MKHPPRADTRLHHHITHESWASSAAPCLPGTAPAPLAAPAASKPGGRRRSPPSRRVGTRKRKANGNTKDCQQSAQRFGVAWALMVAVRRPWLANEGPGPGPSRLPAALLAKLLVMFRTASPPKQLPGCRWLKGSCAVSKAASRRRTRECVNRSSCQVKSKDFTMHRRKDSAVRVVATKDAALADAEPWNGGEDANRTP